MIAMHIEVEAYILQCILDDMNWIVCFVHVKTKYIIANLLQIQL